MYTTTDILEEIQADESSGAEHLYLRTRIISFDALPVPGTDFNSLHTKLYRRFIAMASNDDEVRIKLCQRRLLTQHKGCYTATVAGILMCNPEPRQHLPNSYIQAVCYRGRDKDANYQIDAKDFTGPLDEQIMDACKFVAKHNQIAARKHIGREDYPQYSMRAVLEAIVNAVIHHDYSVYESHIRLFIFADRIELCSLGSLVGTLTVEDLRYNQATRNELLARLLSEIEMGPDLQATAGRKRFLELRGEGVGIIMQESEKLSGKTPLYQMHGEELMLTIYAASPARATT